MYLSWKVRQHGGTSKFISLARDVNAGMPAYVVSRCQELLNDVGKPVRGASVLVVGVTCKADVADLRQTPATEVLAQLRRLGADVAFSDPYVTALTVAGVPVPRVELDDAAAVAADLVVLLTGHRAVDHEALAQRGALLLDTRRVVTADYPSVHRL